ncbi:hypothetical protein KEM56_007622, partial [Ascosphaera pollenicola]
MSNPPTAEHQGQELQPVASSSKGKQPQVTPVTLSFGLEQILKLIRQQNALLTAQSARFKERFVEVNNQLLNIQATPTAFPAQNTACERHAANRQENRNQRHYL